MRLVSTSHGRFARSYNYSHEGKQRMPRSGRTLSLTRPAGPREERR